MPATPTQLRIIRRCALTGAIGGVLYALTAIVIGFAENAFAGGMLALGLPIYLFLPVGVGTIIGGLVGWLLCIALREK